MQYTASEKYLKYSNTSSEFATQRMPSDLTLACMYSPNDGRYDTITLTLLM